MLSLLPAPTQVVWDREDEAREQKLRQRPVSALVKAVVTAPPYGQRRGWVPRNLEVNITYKMFYKQMLLLSKISSQILLNIKSHANMYINKVTMICYFKE